MLDLLFVDHVSHWFKNTDYVCESGAVRNYEKTRILKQRKDTIKCHEGGKDYGDKNEEKLE